MHRMGLVGRNGAAGVVLLLLIAAAGCGGGERGESERLARAVALQAEGSQRAAVIELKNLLQRRPDHAEGRWRLGQIYLDLGDGTAALTELERALALGWEEEAASLSIARARLLLGEYRAVLEGVQSWRLPRREDAVTAQVLRGRAFLGLGQRAEAETSFAAALREAPTHVPALTGLARTHLPLGGEGVESARALLQRALAADPEAPEAWRLLGELERDEGRLAEAEHAFTQLVEHAPNPYPGHYLRGLIRIARHNREGAEQDLARLRGSGASRIAARYLSGLLDFHRGTYRPAVEEMEAILRLRPDYAPAHLFAGAGHYALGNRQQATRHLERYLQQRPEGATASRLLALLRAEGGELADARVALERLLVAHPEDTAALGLLAGIHRAEGQRDESLALLRRRSSLAPESVSARMELAGALLEAGEREAGIAELEAAHRLDPGSGRVGLTLALQLLRERRFEQALEEARLVAGRRPGAPLAHNLMGLALLGLGRMEEAVTTFHRALEAAPGEPVATANLARIALHQGRPEEVRRLFTASLEARPGALRLLLGLAAFERRHGSAERAAALYRQAITAHPQAPAPYRNLAALEQQAGRHGEALAIARRLQEAADGAAAGHILEGDLHRAAGALEKALTAYDLADRATPSSEAAIKRFETARRLGRTPTALKGLARRVAEYPRDHRARLLLAGAYSESGDAPAAIAHYEQLLAALPDRPALLNNLALLYHRQGDERAEALARRANRLRPDSPRIQDTLGLILLETGSPEEGLALIAAARAALPGERAIAYHHALALARTGRPDAAKAQLRSLLADAGAFSERLAAERLAAALE